MTTFAVASLDTLITRVFVQSADPVDLQNRVNAALATLNADPNALLVIAMNLAGAGDGHTFVVEILATTPVNVASGTPFDPAAATVRCYMAADAFELAVQRGRVLPLTTAIADEQLAGAAQGTRFMGMIVLVSGFDSIFEGAVQQIFSDTAPGTPVIVLAGGPVVDLITRVIVIPAGVGLGYLIDAEFNVAADGAGSLNVLLVDSVAGTVASELVTLPGAETEVGSIHAALDNVPVGARSLILRVSAIGTNFSVLQARMRTDIVLASALIVT